MVFLGNARSKKSNSVLVVVSTLPLVSFRSSVTIADGKPNINFHITTRSTSVRIYFFYDWSEGNSVDGINKLETRGPVVSSPQ